MEGQAIVKKNFLKVFLFIFYLVGIAGHIIPLTRPIMLWLTPYVLLATGVIIFYPVIKNNQWRLFIFFVLCGLFAFFAEVIGVNYGILFGNYFYGETLGFKILSVPVIIGINWMVILAGSISFSAIISKNKLAIIFLSTFFALIFDYLMESVAMQFSYWNWENGTVPIANYLTWGILIFIFTCICVSQRFAMKSTIPAFIFVVQLVYFLALNLAIHSGIIK